MERGVRECMREKGREKEDDGKGEGEREGEKGRDRERREGKRYCSDELLLCLTINLILASTAGWCSTYQSS